MTEQTNQTMSGHLTFDGGIAVVAGGSGGLGAGVVRAFAAAGSDVFFTYNRNKVAAEQLVSEVSSYGRRVEYAQLSLEDSAAVNATVDDVKRRFENIHSVVYAAGPPTPVDFVGNLSQQTWEETFQLDTHACFNLARAVLPILKPQGFGSITAITSTQGGRHLPKSVLSSAPKAAIESMLQLIAKEYGRFGIRANSLRAGWIDAGMFSGGIGGQVSQEAIDSIVSQVPMGKLGGAEDIGNAVVFLSSLQARYLTGETISVDGGWKL